MHGSEAGWYLMAEAMQPHMAPIPLIVHPESAQRLALAFYRHWLSGKASGEALRHAQLEVRQEKPEPCDWAAHILIGVG